jgi:cysteinyl-tRNA synthetase
MAKSTGNIARVRELLDAGLSPRALRYALIAVHYRAAINHSDESLAAAAAAVDRLDALVAALGAYREERADDPDLPALLADSRAAFGDALDDDLAISPALAVVFDLVRELNRRIDSRVLSTADAGRALEALRDLDGVLGVLPVEDDALEPELGALLEARIQARADRDWAASDRLRDELAEAGIAVEDTRDGQRWRRLSDSPHG